MAAAMPMRDIAMKAAAEIGGVLTRVPDSTVDALIAEISQARRIALYGVGREGLMMKAFAMRLYHLGLDAHVVGDMTTPGLAPGDLLIVSAGPGHFATVSALMGVARSAGARVVCVTAQPDGASARQADLITLLPAQTMADDSGPAAASILPMGSLYEGVQYLFFEVVVLRLRDVLKTTAEAMRANHTNLE